MIDDLYAKVLLDKATFFDEPLEVKCYERWHYGGRRAHFGAALMAPDYAWRHGLYQSKRRVCGFMQEARELIKGNKEASVAKDLLRCRGNTGMPSVVLARVQKKGNP